jgi:hypothetical protein
MTLFYPQISKGWTDFFGISQQLLTDMLVIRISSSEKFPFEEIVTMQERSTMHWHINKERCA